MNINLQGFVSPSTFRTTNLYADGMHGLYYRTNLPDPSYIETGSILPWGWISDSIAAGGGGSTDSSWVSIQTNAISPLSGSEIALNGAVTYQERTISQNDTLKAADWGKTLINTGATNDTLYLVNAVSATASVPDNATVIIESRGAGNIVVYDNDGTLIATDLDNETFATYETVGTALRKTGTDTIKLLTTVGQLMGWALYEDTTYASAADSFYVAAGTRTTLQIFPDMTTSLANDYLPYGVDSLWSHSDTSMIGISVGASYTVRVSFKFKNSATAGSGSATLHYDIGNVDSSPIDIADRFVSMPKAANTETVFNTTTMLYSLGTFVSNGCRLQIESITGNTEIYDISVMIRLETR